MTYKSIVVSKTAVSFDLTNTSSERRDIDIIHLTEFRIFSNLFDEFSERLFTLGILRDGRTKISKTNARKINN